MNDCESNNVADSSAPLSLEQEFLTLTNTSIRSNPLPAIIGFGLIAIAYLGKAPTVWVMVWLVLAVVSILVRAFIIHSVIKSPRFSDQQRLNIIYFLNFFNALVVCSSFIFFPLIGIGDAVLVSLVMGSLANGVVISNAGLARATIPYVFIIFSSTAIMWGVFPHTEDGEVYKAYLVSLLAILMYFSLHSISKSIYKLFSSSVEMRQKYADINLQLSKTLDESQAANAAKTRFLAAASHDLRQPVHTLSLLTAALISRNHKSGYGDERISEIIGTMDKSLQSLAVQLDSLLDISKLDAGIIVPNCEHADITNVILSLQQEFSPLANEKELLIQANLPESAIAFTDATLLERLLRNLLSNAVKYTQTGEISLSVKRESDIAIHIKDTGIGIAEDQQKLVFEEFYQVNNHHRDRSNGLGLGLSIVSRLCKLLDIKLELNSAVGQGTEFILRLKKGIDAVVEKKTANSNGLFNQLKVLVIDDEVDILLATRAYLEELDCIVSIAQSSKEALLLTETELPELVIADLRLRDNENGIEVIEAIRSLRSDIPAILVTGDTAPDRLRQASKTNAILLHKPIYSDRLELAMQEALTLPALET